MGPQIFQQTCLKVNGFALVLFFVSILGMGCAAPAHLRNRPHSSTLELSSEERVQQTINRWKGTHISKAIQKWGSPKEVNDDGTGWRIYIWQVPVQTFLASQQHRILSQRKANRLNGVPGTILQTNYNYELTFYARPNGIISKTDVKKNYNPTSEFQWK